METSSVTIEYLTAEEIRGMSVVQVSESVAFGHLSSTPIPNGLYDLRMGPINKADICKTCGLSSECPGHMGHVELAAELYNPFMLRKLMVYLKKLCTKCGHFRCHSDFTDRVSDLFKLLRSSHETTPFFLDLVDEVARSALEKDFAGLSETHAMFVHDVSAVDAVPEFEEKTLSKAEVEVLVKKLKLACAESQRRANHQAVSLPAAAAAVCQPVSGETCAIETLTTLFLHAIPSSKCANCNSLSPLFRLDGYSKLFVKTRGASAVEEKYLFPRDVRAYIDLLFKKEKRVMRHLSPGGNSIFFIATVAVPPNRFRPLRLMGGAGAAAYLPQATLALKAVLDADLVVKKLLAAEDAPEAATAAPGGAPAGAGASVGASMVRLQDALNAFMDSSKNPKAANPDSIKWGIRQLLERKQGLFRMKMMGKRVNYAARSVISPDAMLATNQIGIPRFIAQTLTMPEPVNALNLAYVRELVETGPDGYPGAVSVEDVVTGKTYSLVGRSAQQRKGIAATLLVGNSKVVHRHLRNNDPLLINRQPTLHKPGIMALLVRVLKKEKTLRMHYANCNTFNADFDGDEINAHAPQSFQARSEAINIALCDRQYLGPTAAQPLRGLIQDHVVAGAMLTRRDAFLDKQQFMDLVYAAVRAFLAPDAKLALPTPAILKPQRRYTGKQVVSAFLAALVGPGSGPGSGLNMSGKSRTAGDLWNSRLDGNKEEEQVVVRDNELLQGVLDKNAFGNAHGGLAHTVYELLGANKTGLLLTGFARMLTLYLQTRGFTCAMGDLLVKPEEELLRKKLLQEATLSGWAKMRNWVAEQLHTGVDQVKELRGLQDAIREIYLTKGTLASLETVMLGNSSEYWGKCIEALVPRGLASAFPHNCFSAMVNTGAKGSKVNMSQICALLGQQELEGRRVPLLRTLKSLPSFAAFDLASRAGGFVADRFLSGVRVQEFFFHCMAGREGLIDTAVKTARSGYLQRCLVKGLEALVVKYDHTVRDNGDNAIVQFLYGEDGLDVGKASYLHKLDVLAANAALLGAAGPQTPETGEVSLYRRWRRKPSSARRAEALLAAVAGSARLTAVEQRIIEKHVTLCQTQGASEDEEVVANLFAPYRFSEACSELYAAAVQKVVGTVSDEDERDRVRSLLEQRFMKGMVNAGESVGVLAAQGMGEPSTQMTLNTFHLAGHGGANVTLGIPRLREIVQTASRSISTPSMTVDCGSAEKAKSIADKLERVALKDLVKTVHVAEKVAMSADKRKVRRYEVVVEFVADVDHIHQVYAHLSKEKLASFMELEFKPKLEGGLKKLIRLSHGSGTAVVGKVAAGVSRDIDGEGERDPAEGDADGERDEDSDSSSDASGAYSDGEVDAEAEAETEEVEPEEGDDEEEGGGGDRKRRRVEGDDEEEESRVVSAADDVIFGYAGRLVDNRYILRSSEIPLSHRLSRKILILEVVGDLCGSLRLQEAEGISRVLVNSGGSVTTEGVNIDLFMEMDVEHNKISTNDIGLILDRYGVEACRASIVKEISRVFGHYGISVDKRHLYLIADYMTHQGNYRPFNRAGIATHASPFMKMTFETSVNFLTQAAEHKVSDNLNTPSGALIVGKLPNIGTGVFDLLNDISHHAHQPSRAPGLHMEDWE